MHEKLTVCFIHFKNIKDHTLKYLSIKEQITRMIKNAFTFAPGLLLKNFNEIQLVIFLTVCAVQLVLLNEGTL